MKSNPLTDPLDVSDGFFSTAGDGTFASFLPPVGSPFANIVPVIVPEEAAQAETANAASGSGGTGSVVAETSGSGFTVNLLFDAAAMAAPTSFRAGIEQAASILAATISDKITVNIKIDYSGTGGGAAAGPDNGNYENYSSIRADLASGATVGDPTFDALPSGSTVQGQSSIAVWNAQLKLFGLVSANSTTTDDGSATFSTDINSNLLVGVALHELTHAMGRVPYGAPYSSSPDIFDLYRFTSPGSVLINGASTAPAAFFSVDGGNTKLADFGQNSDPSDFLNSGVQGSNDPFNEYYSGGTLQSLTTADKEMLDALGFHLTTAVATTIHTDTNSVGSTSLVGLFNDYYLQSATSPGSGVELKYQGAPITAGQWGAWEPIGAVQTSTGYMVAWELPGATPSANEYTVWNTDANGNDTANATGTVLGTSTALQALETTFNQDLNGDGVIGIPSTSSTVIQTDGSTSLVQTGNHYFLDSTSTGTGPELKYQGAPITAGEWGGWEPIGAVQTSTGYMVAWELPGATPSANEYTVWNTDTNGNDTTNTVGTVSGGSPVLQSLETTFHQDLNGDGVIGLPVGTTLIQTDGSTSLVQVGNNYYLENASTGAGPELRYQGAPITAGEWGAWVPIGAVQTSTGYMAAWELPGATPSANQFTVWNTDTNGNDTTNTIGTVSASSPALIALESVFGQNFSTSTATSTGTASAAAQSVSVTVASNDTFVFGPSSGANTAGATTTPFDALASAEGNQFTAFAHDTQKGALQASFQFASGGHETLADPGNHDSMMNIQGHLADLHGAFLLH